MAKSLAKRLALAKDITELEESIQQTVQGCCGRKASQTEMVDLCNAVLKNAVSQSSLSRTLAAYEAVSTKDGNQIASLPTEETLEKMLNAMKSVELALADCEGCVDINCIIKKISSSRKPRKKKEHNWIVFAILVVIVVGLFYIRPVAETQTFQQRIVAHGDSAHHKSIIPWTLAKDNNGRPLFLEEGDEVFFEIDTSKRVRLTTKDHIYICDAMGQDLSKYDNDSLLKVVRLKQKVRAEFSLSDQPIGSLVFYLSNELIDLDKDFFVRRKILQYQPRPVAGPRNNPFTVGKNDGKFLYFAINETFLFNDEMDSLLNRGNWLMRLAPEAQNAYKNHNNDWFLEDNPDDFFIVDVNVKRAK